MSETSVGMVSSLHPISFLLIYSPQDDHILYTLCQTGSCVYWAGCDDIPDSVDNLSSSDKVGWVMSALHMMTIRHFPLYTIYNLIPIHIYIKVCMKASDIATVETPITDPPKGGQPPYSGQSLWHGLKSLQL